MFNQSTTPIKPAYTAVPMAALARPLQTTDLDGSRWICMRSMLEGIGTAWRRWANVFLISSNRWRPRKAADFLGQPTWLLVDSEATNWLMVYADLIRSQSNANTRNRLKALRLEWHTTLYGAGKECKPGPGRRRRVGAETIQALHSALQRTGDLADAAALIGISERTARRLQIYSFPNSTPEMLAAWQGTFGRS